MTAGKAMLELAPVERNSTKLVAIGATLPPEDYAALLALKAKLEKQHSRVVTISEIVRAALRNTVKAYA